jgi:hypothetical protein
LQTDSNITDQQTKKVYTCRHTADQDKHTVHIERQAHSRPAENRHVGIQQTGKHADRQEYKIQADKQISRHRAYKQTGRPRADEQPL